MFRYGLMPRLNVEFSTEDIRFASNNIKNDEIRAMTIKRLSEIYGIGSDRISLTNSGRTALYLILRSLDLKSGSKVGVQLYTCPVVFEAIKQAGFEPYFLEINGGSYTLDTGSLKTASEELDALIVVHTFGNPADMDKINKLLGDRPVIEDCAHAVYTTYKNKFTGTLSDASFLSFGPGKNISAGGGGAIILNNNDVMKTPLKDLMKELKGHSEDWQKKFLNYNRLKAFFYSKPYYGLFAFDVAQKLDSRFDFQSKTRFELEKIENANIAVLYRRLNNFKDMVENQKQHIASIDENLVQDGFKTIERPPQSSPLYYLYPIRFGDSVERDTAWNRLRKAGIDSMKYYIDTPEIAREKYGYRDTCKDSEKIIDTTLLLPTYYNYGKYKLSKVLK